MAMAASPASTSWAPARRCVVPGTIRRRRRRSERRGRLESVSQPGILSIRRGMVHCRARVSSSGRRPRSSPCWIFHPPRYAFAGRKWQAYRGIEAIAAPHVTDSAPVGRSRRSAHLSRPPVAGWRVIQQREAVPLLNAFGESLDERSRTIPPSPVGQAIAFTSAPSPSVPFPPGSPSAFTPLK